MKTAQELPRHSSENTYRMGLLLTMMPTCKKKKKTISNGMLEEAITKQNLTQENRMERPEANHMV